MPPHGHGRLGTAILGSPKTGLINTIFKWAHLDWHVDFYSLTGLVVAALPTCKPIAHTLVPCVIW